MLEVKSFTFNPFQENTFLLINERKDCFIIDPGAYFKKEQQILLNYIESNKLSPIRLLNTHCHLDHVFGNKLIFDHFGLKPEFHKWEKAILAQSTEAGLRYDLPLEPSPEPENYLEEKDRLQLGEDQLSILLAPGHSPGSLCFYCEKQSFLIGGDVLFNESIGRTDLPGGNAEFLTASIREKLYLLPDETVVYTGHGPETTIGHEKQFNPFVRP